MRRVGVSDAKMYVFKIWRLRFKPPQSMGALYFGTIPQQKGNILSSDIDKCSFCRVLGCHAHGQPLEVRLVGCVIVKSWPVAVAQQGLRTPTEPMFASYGIHAIL